MSCWICRRQARGFGHLDTRFKHGDARRYVRDWVFCSGRCQDAFHALYGNWRRVKDGRLAKTEVIVMDPSEIERVAQHQCLKAFGAVAEAIGFNKSLGEYSESEVLSVIAAIIACYTQAMHAHHVATAFPPVRRVPAAPDPFADLEDPALWDAPNTGGA